MNDNSNNVHFSGVRCIYPAIKSTLALEPLAYNSKMRAANKSYALEMNIIVILSLEGEWCIGEIAK